MRKAARIDANQNDLVKALRRMGATVDITSAVGDGFTDLVVNKYGITVKVEVKDGDKPKSQQKLTADQVKHHRQCKGAIAVVNCVEHCVLLLLTMKKQAEALTAAGFTLRGDGYE